MSSIETKLTSLLTAINDVTGMNSTNLTDAIQLLKDGYGSSIDFSGVDATASDVTYGKVFINGDGEKTTGSVTVRSSSGITYELAENAGDTALRTKVTAGIYKSTAYKQIPTESVNITASDILSASDASTYTKTIGHAADALIRDITLAGDANLIASNIRSGISIFGRTGTYTGGNIATATATAGTGDIKTLSFTVSGSPTWFALYADSNTLEFTPNSSSKKYISSGIYDGIDVHIKTTNFTALYMNSSFIRITMYMDTTHLTKSYSNGTLTFSSSNAGSSMYFIPSATYSLLYGY